VFVPRVRREREVGVRTNCSYEHADACLRALMRMLNGETGDREELASIRAAPKLSPDEMQERVDELERKLHS